MTPSLVAVGVVLLLQAAYLAAVHWVARSNDALPELVPLDALALPGARVLLAVRATRPAVSRPFVDYDGSAVAFAPRESPGPTSTMQPEQATFAGGVAQVEIKAPVAPGAYAIEARHSSSSPTGTEPPSAPSLDVANIVLEVAPSDRPLLFVTVPETISSGLEQPGLGGAATALKALQARFALVYVALREFDSPERLRAWLARNSVPLGPVLTARQPGDGEKGGLDRLLGKLQLDRWKGPHAAIVSNAAEAGVFAARGFRVAVLGATPGGAADSRSAAARIHGALSWNDAMKIIEGSR